MKAPILLLTGLALVLGLVAVPTQARVDEGACIAWDITGSWRYDTSSGGQGTVSFQQNLGTGWLSGSWTNQSQGDSGP